MGLCVRVSHSPFAEPCPRAPLSAHLWFVHCASPVPNAMRMATGCGAKPCSASSARL